MRRGAGAVWACAVLLGSGAFAEEAGDRAGIDQAIAAVNQNQQRAGVFKDEGLAEYGRLPNVNVVEYRIGPPTLAPTTPVPTTGSAGNNSSATVQISQEPWGEAKIVFGAAVPGFPQIVGAPQVLSPRITAGQVRFVAADVALVDGTWTYKDVNTTQTVPILLVMKREGDAWKIASVRLLKN